MVLSTHQLYKSFADQVIFENISLTIQERDRIGFIGANGAGKTTLLNCILDPTLADTGEVFVERGQTIGYLKQNAGLNREGCIYDEMLSVFAELLAVKEQMTTLEHILATMADHDTEEYHHTTSQYAKLASFFEAREGYGIDVKIKTILTGMGFSTAQYGTAIGTLSGGEKMRLAMAKLLLEEPSLLILDEPTNHLDFRTLAWLEDYLQDYKGAILVVSHDRYFLDKMVSKIWEIARGGVTVYPGNYTKFKLLKQEKLERDLKEYEQQQLKISSMQTYAEKNIARASTSSSAKSRLAQLAQMEVLEKPHLFDKTPYFRFDYQTTPVKDVLTVEHLDLVVGEGAAKKTLCTDLNFEVKRGDRIALIGPNGIGKSTMLRAVLNQTETATGDIFWGRNVQIAFYEQENQNLNFEQTLLEELWGRHPSMLEFQVRSILGQMLISDDQIYKKVASVSGGERARLGFAVMMTEGANFLFFDEPTNHLDLASKEALEQALQAFDGTLLFVSHDRYFLNNIPNKIWALSAEGLCQFVGNYDEYLEQLKRAPKLVETVSETAKSGENASQYNRSKQQRAADARRRNRLNELEKLVAALDEEIAFLEEQIADPAVGADYEKLQSLCARLEEAKAENDDASEEWLTLL